MRKRILSEAEYYCSIVPLFQKLRGKNYYESKIVIVASAHKVGSTWLYQMIKDIGPFEVRIPRRLKETGTLVLDHKSTMRYLKFIKGLRIFKSHSYPVKFSLDNVKLITMYRDPRDVIVSSIFYLANLDEKHGGWGEEFKQKTETERIKEIIVRGDFLLSRLEEWYRNEEAYKVSYEDLSMNTVTELKKVIGFMGLKVKEEDVLRVVEKNEFEKKAGRMRGKEDKTSFYRKGVSGDWRYYFDTESVKMFKEEKNGQWNKLLVEMGYENDLKWE